MVYSVASFGVSVNYFFCCGKLKEVSVKLNPPFNHKCPMKGGKDCCKSEKVDIKISADQQFSQSIVFDPLIFSTGFLVKLFDCDSIIDNPQYYSGHQNKPPPLSQFSLNILYSNFRI